MPEVLFQTDGIHGFRFHALGGAGRIRMAGCPRDLAERAVAGAVRWLREAEARLSRFRPDSLISQLNREGLCPSNPELDSFLAIGEQARMQTRGRFHITGAPLWNLWHDPARELWPDDGEIEAARARSDPGGLACEGGTIRIRAGMAVDLGGIAKEWCVDELVVRLRAAGVRNFLVELAGDVAARGHQPGHGGWWVLLPDGRHSYPLCDAALATSGHHSRGRRLDGRWVSHLIDAARGLPASGAVVTATVLAPTCTEAGLRATDAALAPTWREAWERTGHHQTLLRLANGTTRVTPALAEACAEVNSSFLA